METRMEPGLTRRGEETIKAVHFYRYMTALDVAHRLYTPSVLTRVRKRLRDLAGGGDFIERQYLYRFRLLTDRGNPERVYTLGSKGRKFLVEQLGMSVGWYFRPEKVRHSNHRLLLHNLLLTRVLVAAHSWSAKHPGITLEQTRICYELQNQFGTSDKMVAIPDAWLLFEQKGKRFPILLEIDRGMEYQVRFKQHVLSRIEFIDSGMYEKMFGTQAVIIAYVTTGETPEYRETRRKTMCHWTMEVLEAQNKRNWANIFRFASLHLNEIYTAPLLSIGFHRKIHQKSPENT